MFTALHAARTRGQQRLVVPVMLQVFAQTGSVDLMMEDNKVAQQLSSD